MNRLWIAVIANFAITIYMLYGWVIVHRMHPGASMALGFTWLFALQVHLLGLALLFPVRAKSRLSIAAWCLSLAIFAASTAWLIWYRE
jgi:hypothetical protein